MNTKPTSSRPQPPIITLTTDFGADDIFAGVMKGVILGINPSARIVDVTHAVPPHAIELGAFLLRLTVPYFPPGTIHVAVIDPGVGGGRRAVCVETGAGILVGPDNGLLAPAAQQAGTKRVVACTKKKYWLSRHGSTFDGRDVFAPVAAHLSRGLPLESLGAPGVSLCPLELPRVRRERRRGSERVLGQVLHADRFGNLLTNITATDIDVFPPRELSVSIAGAVIDGLADSYDAVAEGELLALIDSWGVLEIAQNKGSACTRLGTGSGAAVVVTA